MSETHKDNTSGQKDDPTIAEARRLLADIGQFRAQAEEQFTAAELSRKNADSEGLFAVNAKKVCEEHATVISQLKGNVESEANTIMSNRQKSDEFLAALTAGKATIDSDIKTIGERRKEADLAASSIETVKENCVSRAQELEQSKATAEDALKVIVELHEATNQARKSAESSQKEVEAYSANAQKLVDQITEDNATHIERCLEIKNTLENTRASETEIGTVLEHLKKSNEISTGHETRVTELTKRIGNAVDTCRRTPPQGSKCKSGIFI